MPKNVNPIKWDRYGRCDEHRVSKINDGCRLPKEEARKDFQMIGEFQEQWRKAIRGVEEPK